MSTPRAVPHVRAHPCGCRGGPRRAGEAAVLVSRRWVWVWPRAPPPLAAVAARAPAPMASSPPTTHTGGHSRWVYCARAARVVAPQPLGGPPHPRQPHGAVHRARAAEGLGSQEGRVVASWSRVRWQRVRDAARTNFAPLPFSRRPPPTASPGLAPGGQQSGGRHLCERRRVGSGRVGRVAEPRADPRLARVARWFGAIRKLRRTRLAGGSQEAFGPRPEL